MVWNYSDKDVKLLMASAQVFAKVFIGDSSSELLKQRSSRIDPRQCRSDSGGTGSNVSDRRVATTPAAVDMKYTHSSHITVL